MDSDVELKSSLKPFLNHSFFISQTRGNELHVGPHCYGAEKGHPLLKEMVIFYRSHHFIPKKGYMDQTRVGIRLSMMIKKLYNIKLNNKIAKPIALPNNGSIYPTFYFEKQIDGKINIANHFCTNSWCGKNYEDEKYLSSCYNSCRKDLKKSKTKENQKVNLNYKNLKDIIQTLYVYILLLIIVIKYKKHNWKKK